MNDTPPGDQPPPRYGVGIDLGTTHCVLSYVDYQNPGAGSEVLPIEQWVTDSVRESRLHLASFHYQPPGGRPPVVGEAARAAAAGSPGRVIASAKSWLSHQSVDRTADLLPWHGDADVPRLSPAAASSAYLKHLVAAWDAVFVDDPLATQDVVITLPASFDETARELTLRAAADAGLPAVSLIEEPQAAMYAWIDRHEAEGATPWTEILRAGQLLLVVDIGGGTTDLTLIRVRTAGGKEGSEALQLHRVAVGEHLLLGGDNLDLAIAKEVESQSGDELLPADWLSLVAQCRGLKEWMLLPQSPPATTLTIAGGGTSMIGGGKRLEVTAEMLRRVVLEGFFPVVPLDAQPHDGESGFREFGLPYAADAAITRHLAAFVRQHRRTGMEDQSGSGVPPARRTSADQSLAASATDPSGSGVPPGRRTPADQSLAASATDPSGSGVPPGRRTSADQSLAASATAPSGSGVPPGRRTPADQSPAASATDPSGSGVPPGRRTSADQSLAASATVPSGSGVPPGRRTSADQSLAASATGGLTKAIASTPSCLTAACWPPR